MNLFRKYLKDLWGALSHISVALILILIFLAINPLNMSEVLSGFDDPFWYTSYRRAIVIIMAAAIYFPIALALIRFYSYLDKRYTVANNTLPDSVFGGLKEASLLICAVLVFIQLVQVCLL